jgi:transcriptional regulator with XRE-family HTH domain
VPKDVIREQVCAEIVRLLTEERKRLGISGNSLAEKSGLSQSLISTLETNPWNPTLDTLLRIADALNIDLGRIISSAQANVFKTLSSSE